MNKTALALISSLIFVLPLHAQDAKPRYSLKTIETNPVPKKVFFILLKPVALSLCYKPHEISNVSYDECIKIVNERSDKCVADLYKKTPAIISKKQTYRKIARPYLECAIPGVFCYGIEVKTVEQFYRHCQDPNAVPSG
jgi:hypothetical protein